MYKKLDISLSELDVVKLKGDSPFGYPTFREFSILDTDYLFDTLSKQVQFDVMPKVNITEIKYPGATPHTDTWPTAINFYFDIGDDETFFWKEITAPLNNKDGLTFYDPKNLEQIGSFKISDNLTVVICVIDCSIVLVESNSKRLNLTSFVHQYFYL